MYMVGETGPEDEKTVGEVRSEGNPWVAAGMTETLKNQRNGGGTRKGELVEAKERMPMTLETWMPKKVEITNKYQILQVEDEKEEAIVAIKAEEENGVVMVTVDSGAAKNVWPRSRKGVLRKKNRGETKAGGGEWDED